MVERVHSLMLYWQFFAFIAGLSELTTLANVFLLYIGIFLLAHQVAENVF